MVTPFGGGVDILTAGKLPDDKKAFVIFYKDIPQEACIDIVTQDWGSGSSSGLIAIGVYPSPRAYDVYYGCTWGDPTTSHCADDGVMSVAKAVSLCTDATSNNISWKFY